MNNFETYGKLLKYPGKLEYFEENIEMTGFNMENIKDLHNLQEEYVNAFDFNPKAALTLTVHVTSSDKDRNDILLGLNSFLKEYNIEKSNNATPDFIPDVLKAYQKALEKGENHEALTFINGMLTKASKDILKSLEKQKSFYANLFKNLCAELEAFSYNGEEINV